MMLKWLMFLPSLVVLFWPIDSALPRHLRLRELSYLDFKDPGSRRRAPWRLPLLWADGVRSFFGAFLLVNAWVVEPTATETWFRHVPVAASALILALSLLAQMHTLRRDDYFLAPVVYVAGVWLALAPLPVALVTVAAGGVCMVAFRSLSAFFFFGAVTMGVFGCVVLHDGLWVAAAAALGLLPCLLSLALHRLLAVPVRVEVVTERSRDGSKLPGLPKEDADGMKI